MQLAGILISGVGAVLGIYGTFRLWRIRPERFNRDMTIGDFGGDKVLAEYVGLVQNPTFVRHGGHHRPVGCS